MWRGLKSPKQTTGDMKKEKRELMVSHGAFVSDYDGVVVKLDFQFHHIQFFFFVSNRIFFCAAS